MLLRSSIFCAVTYKHEYRTYKVNQFVESISDCTDVYSANKNANFQFNLENSRLVVPTGIEPVSKV